MNKERAAELIQTGVEAWIKHDADLILSVFTPDAVICLDPRGKKLAGHDDIRAYWKSKVTGYQEDIAFKLLNLWIDGNVVIAEWNVDFTDIKKDIHSSMTGVSIFETKGNLFSSLRFYYSETAAGISLV